MWWLLNKGHSDFNFFLGTSLDPNKKLGFPVFLFVFVVWWCGGRAVGGRA
jgi:hypothetical protein